MGGRGTSAAGKYGGSNNTGANTPISAANATQMKAQAQQQAQQQRQAQPPKKQAKLTKKQAALQDLTDYIKTQTKVDITPYHEAQFDGKGYVTLDWNRMSNSDKTYILNLANKFNRLEIVDYGSWGKWIKLK